LAAGEVAGVQAGVGVVVVDDVVVAATECEVVSAVSVTGDGEHVSFGDVVALLKGLRQGLPF
jgi:hypothetical protein